MSRAALVAATLCEVLGVDVAGLPRDARGRWEEEERVLATIAESSAVGTAKIDELRRHFRDLSRSVLTLERAFRHVGSSMYYEAFCPMAFNDTGATWLQTGKEIENTPLHLRRGHVEIVAGAFDRDEGGFRETRGQLPMALPIGPTIERPTEE